MTMMSRELYCDSSTGNQLLSSLPAPVLREIGGETKNVLLRRGTSLYEVSDAVDYLYFPVDGLLGVSVRLRDGSSPPVFTVGSEGMVGLQAILGSSRSFLRVFVYSTGGCVQMPVRALPRLAQHESVRRMFQRYTIAFMSCMTQHCACSRAHDVLQRCAAQLLMASDRVGRPEFVLTQEFLAEMLGLRRVNVGMAAQQLQRMGCIEYVRGHVKVRDRPRLESAACECYLAVKQHLDGVRD